MQGLGSMTRPGLMAAGVWRAVPCTCPPTPPPAALLTCASPRGAHPEVKVSVRARAQADPTWAASLQHGVQLVRQVIEHAADVVQDAACALLLRRRRAGGGRIMSGVGWVGPAKNTHPDLSLYAPPYQRPSAA